MSELGRIRDELAEAVDLVCRDDLDPDAFDAAEARAYDAIDALGRLVARRRR